MRLATYLADDRETVGVVRDDDVVDLRAAFAAAGMGAAPADMVALIAGGAEMLAAVAAAVAQAGPAAARPLAGVRLLAPIPHPHKNVFCVGRNYKLHIEEGARARGVEPTFPTVPEFFSKPPTTVIGAEAEIRLDSQLTKQLDYEVELAIVIGRRCRDVETSAADEVIFGYTIANDVTARDLQRAHGQWFKGKSLDTTLPCGPWIVTRDEFGDPAAHRLSLTVNGEGRQDSTIGDMLFDCREIVASLSAGLTLEPGDIICTGTPSGVGLGLTPQSFLQDGDVVECAIEGIGRLRNRVADVRRA
jgi:2-keto-4-pentenoate hydratase/2-oxohepta-3-ene-1,7-dioic acid hydratase in catechol pathway